VGKAIVDIVSDPALGQVAYQLSAAGLSPLG